MTYFLRSLKRKNFQLEKNEHVFNKVLFESWKNNNAVAKLPEAIYTFKKFSFWRSKYVITKNDYPIGLITSNWKGRLFFKLLVKEYEDADLVPDNIAIENFEKKLEQQETITYTMRSRGVFKIRYEIFLEETPKPILTFYSKSKWFKVNYEVVIHEPEKLFFSTEALINMFGYGAFLIRQRRAAAGAAAS